MPETDQSRPRRWYTSPLGDFSTERQLGGQPGVSTMYVARDVRRGGRVVLRVLRFLADRPADQQELIEAVALRARLADTDLAPVIAAGRSPEGAWIATHLDAARNLEQLLDAEAPLSPQRSIAILRPVAAALDAAHAVGLVCDSLTGGGVLLSGEPGVDEQGQLTDVGPQWPATVRPGRLLGDVRGLAPEEIRGAPPTPASNVYALAALLVQCLTGAPPFPAPTRAAVLSAHLSAPPPRVSERVPGLPASLDDLIGSGLSRDPAMRPASAGALIAGAVDALGEETAREGVVSSAPGSGPGPLGTTAISESARRLRPPRPSRARPVPNPRAMRWVRRVAVLVPATVLLGLAVIAALHAGPLTRQPAPSAKHPRPSRTATPPAATGTLSAPRPSGAGAQPTGATRIAASPRGRQLTIVAERLPAEGRHPPQAYAVWLFNSRRDALLLGFVVPRVGNGGKFVSHQDLPSQASRYGQIVVTLESKASAGPQGPMVLRGEIPISALRERPSGR
jgi:hypothetical protein